MTIRVSWGHMEPHFGGRGGRRGSAMVPFERAMVVSYRLSIVTVALFVTIRPQFCDRMSPTLKSTGVGHFETKFPVAPMMFGSAESERPTLTNREIIIFEKFQSQSTNVTDRRRAGLTIWWALRTPQRRGPTGKSSTPKRERGVGGVSLSPAK